MGTLLVLTGSSLSFGQTALPYSENFTASSGWTMNNGTQPNQWYIGNAGEATGDFLYISGDTPEQPFDAIPAGNNGATNNYRTYGANSAISVTHAYKDFAFTAGASAFNLQFDWRLMGEANFDFMTVWIVPTTATITPGTRISIANVPTAIQVGTAFNGSNSWATTTNYALPASLQGTTARLVFEWSNNAYGGDQRPAAVDNINLTVVNCPAPTALNATNITTTSAELSWTETAIATDWEIQYGLATFFPGAGPSVSAGTNPFVLTGLQPASMYDYYVRAVCGTNDESAWSGPFRFSTLCDVITTLPWTENFDNLPLVGSQLFPSCWVDENPGNWFTSSNATSTLGQTPFSGTNFLNIGSDIDAKIWTPEFALTAGEAYEFSFQFAGDLGAGWDGSVYVNNTQNSAGATMIGTAFAVNGDSTSLAYEKQTYCFTPATTATYTFGVYVTETNFENYLSFDDFELKLAPTYNGLDGALTVCQSSGLLDLNTVITTTTTDGTWTLASFPTSLNGNMFDPSVVTSGVHSITFTTNSCNVDVVVATITVEAGASAGVDGTLAVCRNQSINLFAGLSGNVATDGVWTDPMNVVIPNGITTASNIPGQYNFKYVVTNTACPNDSSKVIVVVQGCIDVGVEEIAFKAFNLYPNPTSDLIFIVNSGSTEVFNYEVLDVNGRVMLSENEAINGSTTTEINLSTVQNGVYMVRAFNAHATKTFRVVKN